MKLVNFALKGSSLAGLVSDDSKSILPLHYADGAPIASIDSILSEGKLPDIKERYSESMNRSNVIADHSSSLLPIQSVKLLSPVLAPEKIYCTAVNYVSHGKEQEVSPPSEPYFFTKFRNSLIGEGDPILVPRISKKVDWEVELAVIIGKKGKYIRQNEAMSYVAGYTIANDVSFRDLRFGSDEKASSHYGQNWVKAKGLDNAFPLGPWLVTTDELKNPYQCTISLSVNGVERQKSKIGEMVFKIDRLIEYASAGTTLVPGDVISTGTPLGVAAFTGAPYLKDGDVVEAKIENIGVLRNPVRDEGAA
ncbi:MAG TPA: fumarylacetoacetate hydrolase family protein [Nitrososphaerales archaeon]|nr:fumarylacetoacetate hydrolase family protein [Nitrososphaerales archaeon]